MLAVRETTANLEGVEGVKTTPKFKTRLTWYFNNAMNSRKTKLYQVKNGAFDILLGNAFIMKK